MRIRRRGLRCAAAGAGKAESLDKRFDEEDGDIVLGPEAAGFAVDGFSEGAQQIGGGHGAVAVGYFLPAWRGVGGVAGAVGEGDVQAVGVARRRPWLVTDALHPLVRPDAPAVYRVGDFADIGFTVG